ncbi:hypothetical protein H6P81_003411 [Aristolochia fimbriata]|uniref:AB hydrolase-1 domain-containing protein n=1 Tax=Aristolochia fimbriata TaxID=158543 RepID=A0AAV7FCP0_ARIFI|nr:hypothetical protein H6P81_003411 [Aristolochia fimbriata]
MFGVSVMRIGCMSETYRILPRRWSKSGYAPRSRLAKVKHQSEMQHVLTKRVLRKHRTRGKRRRCFGVSALPRPPATQKFLSTISADIYPLSLRCQWLVNMFGILKCHTCGCEWKPVLVAQQGQSSGAHVSCFRRSVVRTVRPFEGDIQAGRLILCQSSKTPLEASASALSFQSVSVDKQVASGQNVTKDTGILAYDLVQGALVRWNSPLEKSTADPPTAVLLHGILGCRKNWGSFARRLAQEFPMWQFLLVDLRCHGDSAQIKKSPSHTVASAALDVLKLVAKLRVTPRVLVGHSFGGKVALSMVEQAAKPLARPVRVWVLDSAPGKVRPGGDGEDHPAELISFLSRLPKQVLSKREILNALIQEGFSKDVAQWVVTNLRQFGSISQSSHFSWVFDLKGINEMYRSYEETNLWNIVEDVPRGVHINFLKAERSLHRWALEDIRRIRATEELALDEGAGVEMHVLEDAGHWVHADNPDGLFRILSTSFQGFRP